MCFKKKNTTVGYGKKRRMAKSGTFEWIVGWEELASHLAPAALGLPASGARAVDLGCGTSELAVHLVGAGYSSVTAMDRDSGCIEHMRARHGSVPGLSWRQCDLVTGDMAELLPGGLAELVLDKGTLDCAICEDTVAQLLLAVRRVLAAGGVYVAISFRSAELLRPLLTCDELGMEPPELEPIVALRGEDATLCRLRTRHEGGGADAEAVAGHVQRVMDWWYREQQPLLTPERREALETAWQAQGAGAGGGRLPLRVAFGLVLSADEQEEVGLEGFVEDVRGFLEHDAADLSLEQAVAYLEGSQ